jgi:hypothetical protein
MPQGKGPVHPPPAESLFVGQVGGLELELAALMPGHRFSLAEGHTRVPIAWDHLHQTARPPLAVLVCIVETLDALQARSAARCGCPRAIGSTMWLKVIISLCMRAGYGGVWFGAAIVEK